MPRTFDDGSRRWTVSMPSMKVGRGIYEPGWRWSLHAGPQRGKPSSHHIGYIEAGAMMVRTAGGDEVLVTAGQVFEVGPDHDAWVVGDQPCIALDFATD